MVQMPRPWVAATSTPLGSTVSWSTTTLGRLVPRWLQVAPLSDDTNTPKSDATISLPFLKTMSLMGAPGGAAARGLEDVAADQAVVRADHPVARVAGQ